MQVKLGKNWGYFYNLSKLKYNINYMCKQLLLCMPCFVVDLILICYKSYKYISNNPNEAYGSTGKRILRYSKGIKSYKLKYNISG